MALNDVIMRCHCVTTVLGPSAPPWSLTQTPISYMAIQLLLQSSLRGRGFRPSLSAL